MHLNKHEYKNQDVDNSWSSVNKLDRIKDYIISLVQSNVVFNVCTVIRTSLGFFLLINKFV